MVCHKDGAGHDSGTMSACGHCGIGVYQLSWGDRKDGRPAFARVMAYAAGEQPWLGHVSSPGSTSCGAACGVQDHADNVRSLRTMAPVIAGFRGQPGTQSNVDVEAHESEADGPMAARTSVMFGKRWAVRRELRGRITNKQKDN